MNEAIKAMAARPGRYAVSSTRLLIVGLYFEVEVTEDGKVYQLNQPERTRGDELTPDVWVGDEWVSDINVCRNVADQSKIAEEQGKVLTS